MKNPVDSLAHWLTAKFSFKTLLVIFGGLMFIAGMFWGSLIEKLLSLAH